MQKCFLSLYLSPGGSHVGAGGKPHISGGGDAKGPCPRAGKKKKHSSSIGKVLPDPQRGCSCQVGPVKSQLSSGPPGLPHFTSILVIKENEKVSPLLITELLSLADCNRRLAADTSSAKLHRSLL